MSFKILLVEDNPITREAIKKTLESVGYEVAACSDGKIALQLLKNQVPDLVLADIRMPNMTGIELLKEIKEIKSPNKIPVILMTGFSELSDALGAHALGAAGFLAKPFQRDELVDLMQSLLSGPPKTASLGEEFIKIPIDAFITGSEIKYNIYIRLSDNDYAKIAHQGEDIILNLIMSYKERGIDFIYLKKDDYKKYLIFNVDLMSFSVSRSNTSNRKKMVLITHAAKLISQYQRSTALDQEIYAHSQTMIENAISALSNEEHFLDFLNLLSDQNDYLYLHGIAVSMMTIQIARKVGWESNTTLLKLAMGGFFHDIGNKDLDPAVISKMDKDLSPDDLRRLKEHPARGFEILSNIKSIPDDIAQIALQHHENYDGSGYPSGIAHRKIHPMARIVAVANEYCNLLFKGPDANLVTAIQALYEIQRMSKRRFDPEFVDALQNVALSKKDEP